MKWRVERILLGEWLVQGSFDSLAKAEYFANYFFTGEARIVHHSIPMGAIK
jgi:hypothetical protein